jgi:hypothetical protein
MKPEQVKAAVAKYRELILKGFPWLLPNPTRVDTSKTGLSINTPEILQHMLYMCDEIDKMLEVPSTFPSWKEWEPDAEVMGKAFRWLGFLQGLVFSLCLCSIDDLRGDNRS